jgi:tetratricopeptide (TPR) repeat protein
MLVMRPRRHISVGCALLAVVLAGEALADDAVNVDPATEARARVHSKQARAAFELSDFAKALGEYETAYHLAAVPGLLFNIGQCHRNLGDYKKAVFTFRAYLRKKPDAANREAVLRLIEELEIKLETEKESQQLGPPPRAHEGPHRALFNPPSVPPQQPPSVPVYRRWWLWAGLVAVAGGAAVATYFATRPGSPNIPGSDLGVWDLSRPR